MRLDDGMGYDGQRPTRSGVRLTWPMVLAAVLAVAVVALIASSIATARTAVPTDPGATAAGGPATTVAADPTVSGPVPPTPPPAATPDHAGHDAEEQTGASLQVWGAFEAFMAAWCSTDPVVRRDGFDGTATADLADGLAETIPENVITAPRTKVEVVGAGPYSAEFRVWFERVPTSVHVILIADPGSPHGWRVTRVEKRGD